MSQFTAMTRSFSRGAGSALKTMGLSGSPSSGTLARKGSKLRSQDGCEMHGSRPCPILEDSSMSNRKLKKKIVPKSAVSQRLILEVRLSKEGDATHSHYPTQALQNSTLFKDLEPRLRVSCNFTLC